MENVKEIALDSVALKALVGSRAYKLNTKDSDWDYRGFFVLPTYMYWKASISVPEQVEVDGKDIQYWEFDKYIRLLIQSNPNVLETLWSNDISVTNTESSIWVNKLLKHKQTFLTKNIERTYGGYATSQLARGERYIREGKNVAGWKHLMHLLRLLISGNHALRNGDLLIDMSEYRDDLLDVRHGKLTMKQFKSWHTTLESEFNSLKKSNVLPDSVDMNIVDAITVGMRKSMV